ITGSDIDLISERIPAMKPGDVLGHELIGEIVETGSQVSTLKVGERVVVSPVLACGHCEPCRRRDFSCCDNSNPNHRPTEAAYGHVCAGILGHGNAFGGYGGGHAEYVRVPFA